MMYLKEMSATNVNGNDVEYFRYENWEGNYISTPFVDREGTLAEDLTDVFGKIEKESQITIKTPSRPPITAELSVEWDECLSVEKSCDSNKGDYGCGDECPYYREHNTRFICGDTDEYIGKDGAEILPPELMKVLIKEMPEKIKGSIMVITCFKVINLDTDNVIIRCEDDMASRTVVVEIDTTEVDAARKLLIELGLITT